MWASVVARVALVGETDPCAVERVDKVLVTPATSNVAHSPDNGGEK